MFYIQQILRDGKPQTKACRRPSTSLTEGWSSDLSLLPRCLNQSSHSEQVPNLQSTPTLLCLPQFLQLSVWVESYDSCFTALFPCHQQKLLYVRQDFVGGNNTRPKIRNQSLWHNMLTENTINVVEQWLDSNCHIIKLTCSRKLQTYIGGSPLSLWTGHFSSKDSLLPLYHHPLYTGGKNIAIFEDSQYT